MAFGLCWTLCCYSDCSLTVCVYGCGVRLGAGFVVNLYRGPVLEDNLVDTGTTGDDGCVTFSITGGSGGYGVFVTPPYGSIWGGLQVDSFPALCPGDTQFDAYVQPPVESPCTDCGPVPQPADLTLSLPGMSTTAETTNGSTWYVDFPIVDCPSNGCPFDPADLPAGASTVTRVWFSLICYPPDGNYYLTMAWLVWRDLPYGVGAGDLYHHCPYPWPNPRDDFGNGTQLAYATGYFKSSFVAGSGSFFVLFDPTFYTPFINTGTPITDPFLTLLCTTGSFTPTVSAT